MENSNILGIAFIAIASFFLLDAFILDTGIAATFLGIANKQISDDLELEYTWKKNELTYYINSTEAGSERIFNIIDSVITKKGTPSASESFSWQEALDKINLLYPDNKVPDKLTKTSSPDADIIIILTDDDNGKIAGTTFRYTQGLIGLVKAEILLFDADGMPDKVLEAVTRHEFGHALGLPHTDRTVDIMKEELKRTNIKINHNNLQDLYDMYE